MKSSYEWWLSAFALAFVLATPAFAIDGPYRISEHAGGVQIWFEAEDFDERIPDDDTYFPVVAGGGLNGTVLSRAGGAGGCVRWDFDIGEAGGIGGDWVMWSRLINPNNESDYLLVEGDPDDPEIPEEEPYPGGNEAPPFVNADDRVFEATSDVWEWDEDNEGHRKTLQDGLNSMYMFHRSGNASRQLDIIMWSSTLDYTPTDEDYLNATVVNAPPCEDPADTGCLQIDVDGPAVNGELVAGHYTVTVEAEDDGGDLILYRLTADNGVDPPIVLRTSGDGVLPVEFTVVLLPGTWTISVTVDDDILCDDEDPENVCTHGPFDVAAEEIEQPERPDTPFRISEYGDGVQIWFEAEDYAERIPDDDTYYPVVFALDAFGDDEEAITRAGGSGGCIRWDFDIEAAGGIAGEWYMWARVINPNNSSDFMLVLGDLGDFPIPNEEPYPGGSGAPFIEDDDRIFEGNVGPEWGWFGGEEGHTKDLLDGVNSMYIFHRQGNESVFWDVFMWTNDPSYVPSDFDYLEAEEWEDEPPDRRPPFHRGDTDDDGTINIADAVGMLNFLFGGGGDTTCKETQDFDNDGNVVITDAVAILLFLFSGGADPAPPGPTDQPCGQDPDAPNTPGDLGCNAYTNC